MKRAKSVEFLGGRWRHRRLLSHGLLALAALYLLFISAKFRHFLEIGAALSGDDHSFSSLSGDHNSFSSLDHPLYLPPSLHRRLEHSSSSSSSQQTSTTAHVQKQTPQIRPFKPVRSRISPEFLRRTTQTQLEKWAEEAWSLGLKAWDEMIRLGDDVGAATVLDGKPESCPSSVSMDSHEPLGIEGERLMFLPCGLAAGSSVTVVGTPQDAHPEYVPQLARLRGGDGTVMVAQFMVELQGLKAVDGEDPPKILHLNPRIRGDWSRRPVIEHNTCYRMQWGKAMRCDGMPSSDEDDTVDGFSKCEKWQRSDIVDSKDSKTTSWLQRFIGRAKKPEMTWPFPFVEGRLFVLTIQAGVEGYHIYVGGRHITSFPYRMGFPLEDATGLAVKGNIDVHSVYATSLPTSHPSFSHQQILEMSDKWKSAPLPEDPVYLFIGVLSATNHFAERMAIRKTWMQSAEVKSSNVVARFFVALNPRKEVNAMLKKEAEFFGDIVILPFMDRYELVVLKTIAICYYGVHNVTAAYIMKGDDDTFIRVDIVLREIRNIAQDKSLYMGNLNLMHRPLRSGKWAVTFEEWPEEVYPPYANGPGYIISSDIARYVDSQHTNQSLRLFKMEDVSMGMWVEQFNATSTVQYSHNWKFCQYGCMENYYTAHYQSPRQMICLWDKLARGRPRCCNFR